MQITRALSSQERKKWVQKRKPSSAPKKEQFSCLSRKENVLRSMTFPIFWWLQPWKKSYHCYCYCGSCFLCFITGAGWKTKEDFLLLFLFVTFVLIMSRSISFILQNSKGSPFHTLPFSLLFFPSPRKTQRALKNIEYLWIWRYMRKYNVPNSKVWLFHFPSMLHLF